MRYFRFLVSSLITKILNFIFRKSEHLQKSDETGWFVPPFCVYFFNWNEIASRKEMILASDSNCSLLVKIVGKTTLPNSVLKLSSSFLVLSSISFVESSGIKNVSKHCVRKVFENIYEKSSHPEFILQSVSLKLLEMSWIHCRVGRILKS